MVAGSVEVRAASVTTTRLDDFSAGNLALLQLNGSAAGAVAGDGQAVLRLTPAMNWQTGSAFLKDAVVLSGGASFSTFFSFQFTSSGGIGDSDGIGADGMVFVVHTDAGSTGGAGGGIGYQGITPSLGIEFDTYFNGGTDSDGNHVGINVNGSLNSAARVNVADRFNDGDLWYAWVDYNGASDLLEVRLSQLEIRPTDALLTHNIDLAALLGIDAAGTNAFVGFTAGTGAAHNNHDVRSWAFTNTFDPTVSTVPLPASAGPGLVVLGALAMRRFRRGASGA